MTDNDPNQMPQSTPQPRVNGMAVASLVLGVAWLMWVGSILALVFGYVAKGQIDRAPNAESGWGLAVAGIVLGWVGVGILGLMITLLMTGVFAMPNTPMMNRLGIGGFSSNGESIYMTARNDAGQAITYDGGPGDGMMSGRLACADCHGSDRRGGERQMMMETFYAPDIRWSTLTGDHAGNDGDQDEHPAYTNETIRQAITVGVGAGGRALSPVMPRWHMSEADLTDLVEYLQSRN
jgi:cytochrome c oxidase subunit 2